MSDEATGSVTEELPAELREWLHERAAETDRSPAETLEQAVTVYRQLAAEADSDETVPVDRLADRIAALENELDAKIQDVRERVIQVKRETDTKAPADHAHPDLHEEVETTAEEIDQVAAAVDEIRADLEELDTTVEDGFDNYERVVNHLDESVDDLDRKATILARAVADLRERVTDIESAETRRELTADLKRAANQQGIRHADCGACGNSVDIGLLTAPRCPHCDAAYGDLEPGSRLFRSATLTVGDRPVLDGETDDGTTTAEDVLKGATTDD